MVKKIIFIILMVSVLGCINNNHSKLTISEFNSEKYNIIYYYGRNISFNLLEKKINIHFKEINYYDTIILKKLEEENIIKSFYNNEIYKISGERTYIGNIIIMPNTRDKIQIIKNNKIISKITIDNQFGNDENDKDNIEGYKFYLFKNEIEKILEKNKTIIKGLDSIRKYQQKKVKRL